MEKWIVEFNGKKSDPVSMVRVFHKAVSMYVKEKGVVSKKEVLSELVPQSRMYSESRRNKLLITKDEYTTLVSEHKSNKNRYVYDEPLSLVNENNNTLMEVELPISKKSLNMLKEYGFSSFREMFFSEEKNI